MIFDKILTKIIILLQSKICINRITTNEKVIYLTFDDGPEPEITEFVLDLLDAYNAKATFFCCGNNIEKNSTLYAELINRGHVIGGHTINHLKGSETTNLTYIREVLAFKEHYKTNLFRPPYKSLKLLQCLYLLFMIKIILWDVDSTDWCVEMGSTFNLNNIIEITQPGSIILFHFSKEHQLRTKAILPKYIDAMKNKGFIFKSINL